MNLNTNFPIKMSLDEFYAVNGVTFAVSSDSLDKCRFPHGRTTRQEERDRKRSIEVDNAYYQKRREVRERYNQLVSEGKIIPRTAIEKTVKKANGHPDNPSVQAARRMCEKRGIDWKNYDE